MLNKSFDELTIFPKYSTDRKHKPLEFFLNVIPYSQTVDLKLGFYSSSAFRTIAPAFAQFIFRNPNSKFRIITNHFLDEEDQDLVLNNEEISEEDKKEYQLMLQRNFKDLLSHLNSAGIHFYNCLKFLVSKNRLEFISVKTIRGGMAHFKEMTLSDSYGNILSVTGSVNWSKTALSYNAESITVIKCYNGLKEENEIFQTVKEDQEIYDSIFKKTNPNYQYLNHKSDFLQLIDAVGETKEEKELIEEEKRLRKSFLKEENEYQQRIEEANRKAMDNYHKVLSMPKFPYEEPYRYQKQAYQRWVKKGFKGLFAMATGTGKTLTSLSCVINEFDKGYNKTIIVVPDNVLVSQWVEELIKCNFSSQMIFTLNSEDPSSVRYFRDIIPGLTKDDQITVVTTYQTFQKNYISRFVKKYENEITIIFDECHTMGSPSFKKFFSNFKYKPRLIGLSATPHRQYDEDGSTNDFIEGVFGVKNMEYTFSYSLEEAIGEFLVPYNYYIKFINLDDEEYDQYRELTLQMVRLNQQGKDTSKIAIKRSRIIDKAFQKVYVTIDILKEIVKDGDANGTLIYCPYGKFNFENDIDCLQFYSDKITEAFHNRDGSPPLFKFDHFTSETEDRNYTINQLEKGEIDGLLSKKLLDQGVNIPSVKNAILVSSAAVLRQHVQRRGRVLRLSPETNKTHANIYDIMVLPPEDKINRDEPDSLIKNEFRRVLEFADISKNKTPFKMEFDQILAESKGLGEVYYYSNLKKIIQDEQI